MKLFSRMRWLLLVLTLVVSVSSFAGVFVSVSFGPPALPVYEQPLCPSPGYIWVPGYWAYGAGGYFWVPGTWALAPQPGLLWTPGYWGWGSGAYLWHAGYWGPVVGFYGGINYGYGYTGYGYHGGYWRGRQFYYNRSVNNVNVTRVTNVYNTTVINNTTVNRVSYNGGPGGIGARPTRIEENAARQKHFAPTTLQTRHEQTAGSNRELLASVNHGRPAIAATERPAAFKGRGVVAAREAGGTYNPPANRGAAKPMATNPRANNAVPRPGNNATRPEVTQRNMSRGRNEVPRPSTSSEKMNTSRVESTPRPGNAPNRNLRTETAPNQRVPRPEAATRSERAPREEARRPQVAAPRATTPSREAAPRSQNAPRPQAGARPEASNRKYEQRGPEAQKDVRPERRPQ